MPQVPYYGVYARFDTPDKNTGSLLMGANNLVGDKYDVEFRVEHGDPVPWLRNRFGDEVGYITGPEANELVLCNARGWKINVILASVFYSEQPDPGVYWGEVVAICYPPADAGSFDTFTQNICDQLAIGNRPTVDLGASGYQEVLSSSGAWLPTTRQKKIDLPKGHATIKDHCTMSDNMIEKARKRNPGCMIVGILFDIALVVLVIWIIASFLGF